MIKIDDEKYNIEKIKEMENIEGKIENKFFDYDGNIYKIEINLEKNNIN